MAETTKEYELALIERAHAMRMDAEVGNAVERQRMLGELANALTEARARASQVARIWSPLYDTPITLGLSREQLQAVQDALLGKHTTTPRWREYFAGEIERVLRETIEGSPDSRTTNPKGVPGE